MKNKKKTDQIAESERRETISMSGENDDINFSMENVGFFGGKHGIKIETGGVKFKLNNVNFYEQTDSGLQIDKPIPIMKFLKLSEKDNAKDLYDLLSVLETKKPNEYPPIIKESDFFRRLSITANAATLITVITGLATNPNFQHIMHDLYQIITGAT